MSVGTCNGPKLINVGILTGPNVMYEGIDSGGSNTITEIFKDYLHTAAHRIQIYTRFITIKDIHHRLIFIPSLTTTHV